MSGSLDTRAAQRTNARNENAHVRESTKHEATAAPTPRPTSKPDQHYFS